MRRLSWMVVVVLVGAGIFGITRFAGMWGGGDEGEVEFNPGARGYDFESSGGEDSVTALNSVAGGGALSGAEVIAEMEAASAVPDTESLILAEAEGTVGEELETEPSNVVAAEGSGMGEVESIDVGVIEEPAVVMAEAEPEMEIEVEPVVEPVAAGADSMAAGYGVEAAGVDLGAEMDIDDADEEMMEGLPVAEAEGIDEQAGSEVVASMSVIGAVEDKAEAKPEEVYREEDAWRDYSVSTPMARAAEREPVFEPMDEERPLMARPVRSGGRSDGLGELHGTIDATYVSRFIWRGYDAYKNNHSAFQPSVDLDLFGTGFGLNVWMSRANGSGFEDSEWLDYTAYYGGALFGDEV